VELGRHGIRVNSVGPTYVMTPPLRAKVAAGQRDLDKIMAVHALPRLPEPADIAAAIAFLCSVGRGEDRKAVVRVMCPINTGSGWAAISLNWYGGLAKRNPPSGPRRARGLRQGGITGRAPC
jgi:hypothetical protein